MKSQSSSLHPILISLLLCSTVAIEIAIVPGIWGKIGVTLILALATIAWLCHRFGSGPVRRAFGAAILGAVIGLITSQMAGMMAGMGLRMPISLCYVAAATPMALGALVMSQYPAARFIRFSFMGGWVAGYILLIVSYIFF
ncbi:MAG: hypothetical protein QM758_08390 [Armatimonas sp.]